MASNDWVSNDEPDVIDFNNSNFRLFQGDLEGFFEDSTPPDNSIHHSDGQILQQPQAEQHVDPRAEPSKDNTPSTSTQFPAPVSDVAKTTRRGEHSHIRLPRSEEAKRFVYGDSSPSADQARSRLNGHRKLELEGRSDTFQSSRANIHRHSKHLYEAFTEDYDPAPADWKDHQKEHYARGQANALVDVENRFCTVQECEWAKDLALGVINEIIEMHERGGIPQRRFWKHEKFNQLAPEASLTCSQRIDKVISVVRKNKLIALAVLEEDHVADIIYSPDASLKRRLHNAKTNAKKKERFKFAMTNMEGMEKGARPKKSRSSSRIAHPMPQATPTAVNGASTPASPHQVRQNREDIPTTGNVNTSVGLPVPFVSTGPKKRKAQAMEENAQLFNDTSTKRPRLRRVPASDDAMAGAEELVQIFSSKGPASGKHQASLRALEQTAEEVEAMTRNQMHAMAGNYTQMQRAPQVGAPESHYRPGQTGHGQASWPLIQPYESTENYGAYPMQYTGQPSGFVAPYNSPAATGQAQHQSFAHGSGFDNFNLEQQKSDWQQHSGVPPGLRDLFNQDFLDEISKVDDSNVDAALNSMGGNGEISMGGEYRDNFV